MAWLFLAVMLWGQIIYAADLSDQKTEALEKRKVEINAQMKSLYGELNQVTAELAKRKQKERGVPVEKNAPPDARPPYLR